MPDQGCPGIEYGVDKMNTHETLKNMSQDAFALLGAQEIVYIKPINRNGIDGFAIHAANGQELALVDSHEAALGVVAENQMVPAYLH